MYGPLLTAILSNIKNDRTDIVGELKILRIEEWGGGVYPLTPDDIGEIEVEYDGYSHAIYGFTACGDVTLYMD